MDRDDGGPAFPRPHSWDESPVQGIHEGDRPAPHGAQDGMTLRDYFAAHAPQPAEGDVSTQIGLDRGRNPHNDPGKPIQRSMAEIRAYLRYQHADAMLKARVKEK